MKRLLLFFLLASGASAQTYFHYENMLLGQGGTPISNAQFYVCAGAVTVQQPPVNPPCTTTMVFADVNGSSILQQPGTTSPLGNYGFYAMSGVYTVALVYNNKVTGDIITIPPSTSGNNVWTGQNAITAYNVNNILTVDGVKYTTLAEAFADCPSAGCTIDMRGNSTALTIGSFDPGTKSVVLLLGPYNYSVTQITLRSNLHIIGTAPTVPSGFSGTVLTQASASTAPIILPTSGVAANTVAQGVVLSGFTLAPAVSSTTDGISLVAAGCGVGCSGGGLWYSTFDHIFIQPGFGRNAIRVDGTQCDNCSAMQFASFRDVWAFRSANGNPVLYIIGSYIGQTSFDDCQFDLVFGATDTNANLQNVHIEAAAGLSQNWVPYSIGFKNVTMQFANGPSGIALYVKGGKSIICDNCHFEGDTTIAASVSGAWGMVIQNSYIDAASGSGGLIKIDGNSSLSFHDNTEGTNPPSGGFLVSGSVPTNLYWWGNMNSVGGVTFSPLPNPGMTVAQLPPVVNAIGESRVVNDSTAVAAEGQACVGGSTNKAIAISNGTTWKCF